LQDSSKELLQDLNNSSFQKNLSYLNKDSINLELPLFWNTQQIPGFSSGQGETNSLNHTKSLSSDSLHFLFVCVKGSRFDPLQLWSKILAQGGLLICGKSHCQELNLESNPDFQTYLEAGRIVLVSDPQLILSVMLAKSSQLTERDFFTVAVTGTNGKTSITEILNAALQQTLQQPVLKIGTLGIQWSHNKYIGTTPTMPSINEFTKALALAKNDGCKTVVMEATSQGLHQNRLGHWKVQCGIFSNLTQDHLDYHGTLENYLEAKTLLFTKFLAPLGTAVLNLFDPASWLVLNRILTTPQMQMSQIFSFGNSSHHSQFQSLVQSHKGPAQFLELVESSESRRHIAGKWKWNNQLIDYNSTLLGRFQHENLGVCAAAFVSMGHQLEDFVRTIQQFEIPGRMQSVKGPSGAPLVTVDYAHSPDSLQKTLESARNMLNEGGKLLCVFGCGGDRDKTKRPVMGKIAHSLSDVVVVTSDNPRTELPGQILNDIVEGIPKGPHKNVFTIEDRRDAINLAISLAKKDDIVVIAGKGHEDYQIVGTKTLAFDDALVAKAALSAIFDQK
jgi:UDP-N-acetylmuramoyl-L-alanyl-D-glutamate--2,6-diaminopimelate ligase